MDNKSASLMDEDISILATSCIPSPEEANAIKSRTIARQEMIKEIDEEIEVLCARRNALAWASDIGCAIMAPIRKLPVELLTKIFMECIPPLQTKGSRRRRPRVHPQDVGELLGSVCRAWHTIVNDEPRTWSRLVLDREIHDPEYINQLLKRSNSHPLDIFIEPQFWSPTEGQEEHHDVIFAMLRSELWRTRSFIAYMRTSEQIGAIFPQGFSIDAPMMQTFTHVCDSTSLVEHELDTFHGPKLCSIILRYSQNLVRTLVANPAMHTVSHLEVRFSQVDSTALYLQLLSVLPNLVSLHWNGKEDREEFEEAPLTVVLQSLKSLHLHASGSAMDLLSFFDAPSLESLELLFANQTISMMETLCGNGLVKLRHLHFLECSAVSEAGPDVWAADMLGQLDCLETLIIESSDMLYDLLTALSPQDRDFSSVCPLLTTLVILNLSEVPLGPFVDFVHRRTRADWEEAVPGLVTSLKLSDRDGYGSSFSLCRHFAQSHSATIRFMSKDEYTDTTLDYIFGTPGWDSSEE